MVTSHEFDFDWVNPLKFHHDQIKTCRVAPCVCERERESKRLNSLKIEINIENPNIFSKS